MALTKAEVGLSTSLGITVTRQATGKKKMDSCSPVLSKPDMKGPIYKRGTCIGGKQLIVKVIPDPRYFTGLSRHCFPLSSLSFRQKLDSGIAFTLHYTYMTSLGSFTLWACLTAHHVGPNKHTLICPLYEYSDTAVCDTEIAAGVLGPHRYPSAMPGQKLLHLGQDRLSRPWQAQNLPRSHQ